MRITGAALLAALCAFMMIGPWSLFGALYTAGVLAAFAASAVPMRVEVGADGVLFRWLGRARFVAYASLAGVEGVPGGMHLVAADGKKTMIYLGQSRAARARAWTERMQAAHAAVHAAPREANAVLARGGRGTREWVEALRAAIAATYRGAGLDLDALWMVALSPACSAEERAAASAVLTLQPENERARLRVAADETANPRVRVVLERAAAGDEDALQEAMDRVSR